MAKMTSAASKKTSTKKETKKDAITNPKGRSKGTTSQTQVKRLKPEFRGTISNETIEIKFLRNPIGFRR